MCEVTAKNFNSIVPELEKILKSARFVSLDTEFSCLNASQKLQNSLFDSAHHRYTKLRTTVEQMIPIQIGLTAFTFDRDYYSYAAHIYTFYVFPRSFSHIDTKFLCQASSLQFLSAHKFDFNKFVNEGISYLNRIQENELTKNINNGCFDISESSMPIDFENMLEENGGIISKWIYSAKDNDVLLLKNIESVANNLDIKYFLHRELRRRFKNLWTFEDSEGFKVRKTTSSQYEMLQKDFNLDEYFISDLLGFTRIFRLLISLQKPIIGHNLLLDLMVTIHNFEKPLPKSYTAFKKVVHNLFPTIYDTKCISFNIRSLIPETKQWRQNTLQSLYEYFKDGHGRHVALNSPLIEPVTNSQRNFHYAGWDSYCTGYIFIRMAHIHAMQRYNVKGKKFMSTELLEAVTTFKNSVNIIRGDVSHIQLDGADPISKRPPFLIVETNSNKPVNISEVTSLLSTYGFVEVKPLSFKGDRAIIAVDNFGSARRILSHFNKGHSDFRIQKYDVLKHSSLARTVLWSGVLISSAFLGWYGYSRMK